MRTMKRTIWALCGVMWMSIPGYSTGDVRYDEPQEKETSFKEIPNPEKAARKRVDELDKVLHLSKKQYKYNPQIQISAESETKRSIFREKDKTKRSKKESAQHSKSRNKSFVMTSVSAL